ncbi:galactoside O-acetyltransferase [Corallincola holothuriorum]|uniref:Galactoside O-acetyltransferase n=1 Tax=Corallincola holothuriorum TaxID=2282215 RepID=A0A368N0Z3_9GAMM|nr:DapH/DapD/GlmU-related protein [Corallincola holothuriorum]RCU43294.1 galactoside O-acetyltransferase [Corallincola holothuriorum]
MFIKKRKFSHCGKNVIFDPLSSEFSYGTISLGNNVFIAPQAWFRSDRGRIDIADDVMFGPKVQIYGGNHIFDVIGKKMNENHKDIYHQDKNVSIEPDVWVGGGSIILSGVTIGRGAIIGAGSVVTRNVPAYSIAAGNPCRIIKRRFSNEEINLHESTLNKRGVI